MEKEENLQPKETDMLLLSKVINNFVISLLITVIGMIIGAIVVPANIAMIAAPLITLGMITIAFIVELRRSKKGEDKPAITNKFLYIYAAITGIGLYSCILFFAGEKGAFLVILAAILTFVLFFILALYAKITAKNYLNKGPVLFSILLILVIASITNIFLNITILQFVLSIVSILLFSGYVIYDIQNICRTPYKEELVPTLTLDLYLDLINIFLSLLNLILSGGTLSKD